MRHDAPRKLLSMATNEGPMLKATPDPKPQSPPEVEARPQRRTFTGEYKAKILAECDAAAQPGEIGAILRREGLYSSHLTDWRSRREAGGAAGLTPKKTGRPPKSAELRDHEKELARLRRANAALEERLRRADLIIDAQKKLSAVMELLRMPTPMTGRGE